MVVWPRYQLRCGYGQWLRTAGSYHMALRGLFALIHEILAAVPVGAPMPTAEQLVAAIERHQAMQAPLPLEPTDNPPETQPEPTGAPTAPQQL